MTMTESGAQLSDREREILGHVASGATNQQIANNLGISINTVKVHVRNIFGKIGVASRAEATIYAVRTGVISIQTDQPAQPAAPPFPDAPVEPANHAAAAPPTDAGDAGPNENTPAAAHTAVAASAPGDPAAAALEAQNSAMTKKTAENTRTEQTQATPSNSRVLLVLGLAIGGVVIAAVAIFVLMGNPAPSAGEASKTAVPNAQTNPGFQVQSSRPNPTWALGEPLPAVQQGAAAASFQDTIFVTGGEHDDNVTGATWGYTPEAETWEALADKPTPVTDVRAVVLNGKLYVPGGEQADGSVTDVLELYDPVRDRWESGAALPAARSGYGLVALEGRMYLIGGWDGSTARAEMYIYDPDEDAWEEGNPMPAPRAYGGAVIAKDQIYVLGGENEDGMIVSAMIYDPVPEGGEWSSSLNLMPEPRSRFGIGLLFEYIVLVGGNSGGQPLYYQINTEQWETFESNRPLTPISPGPAVAQQDGTLYIVSGNAGDESSAVFTARIVHTMVIPLRGGD